MDYQFWCACRDAQLPEACELLQTHPDLNVNWKNQHDVSNSSLHRASSKNHLSIVSLLLWHPAIAVNQKNTAGCTPFYFACYSGHTSIVKLMLRDDRVLVNEATSGGSTPISSAAFHGHADVIRWMIASGRELDLGQSGDEYNDAIGQARKNGKVPVVDVLERFRENRTAVTLEIRAELGFRDFPVVAPPRWTYQQYLDFLSDKPVLTETTPLSKSLKTPLSLFATSIPETFSTPSSVSYLSLAHSSLSSLPKSLGSFDRLVELDLSYNYALDDTSVPQITSLLKANSAMINLGLSGTGISAAGLLTILQLVAGETLPSGPSTKRDFHIDGYPVAQFEGTQFIPKETLQEGTMRILELLPGVRSAQMVKMNKNAKSLNFCGLKLSPAAMLQVIQALVFNFSQGNLVLESLEVDDMNLESFDGLGMIPIDILRQGSKKIVQYMLDLFRSPDGDALYRSKLMVVGFESVGKTTILDCLFPLEGELQTQGLVKKTSYWFKLQGNVLSKSDREGNATTHKGSVATVLGSGEWSVVPFDKYGIKLTPKHPGTLISGKKQEEIELTCPDEESHEAWLSRLRRVCVNEATHGIEIQSHDIDDEITKEYFRSKIFSNDFGQGKLSLSVWDFAGQQDYYNNHHYFLSTRTVFVVLWKMSDEESVSEQKGLKGLEFWFKSLATHLVNTTTASSNSSSGTYFSIVVVGTFLDRLTDEKRTRGAKEARRAKVNELARVCGLIQPHNPTPLKPTPSLLALSRAASRPSIIQLQYYEVSCSGSGKTPMENIDEVRGAIVKTALSHSYMGERVPKCYITVSEYIAEMNGARKKREAEAEKERKKNEAEKDRKPTKNLPNPRDRQASPSPSPFSPSSEIPMMKVSEISANLKFGEEGLVRRALALLSLWGECVFFESPPALASVVVTDPRFLAKGILADLFTSDPNIREMKRNGIVRHRDLELIWKRFRQKTGTPAEFGSLCETFMMLLEQLGVCFVMTKASNGQQQQPKEGERSASPSPAPSSSSFLDGQSIIPALLPDKSLRRVEGGSVFSKVWPRDPPFDKPVEIERILKFTGGVVAGELVSRLLVHLHPHIQDERLLMKNEVMLNVRELNETQCWIRAEVERGRFVVAIRGKEVKDCSRLMEWIVEQVHLVSGNRGSGSGRGIICESVRSPHYSGCEIELDRVVNEAGIVELSKREMRCPSTGMPIYAERMLLRAGLIDKIPKKVNQPRVPKWWDLGSSFPASSFSSLSSSTEPSQRMVRMIGENGKMITDPPSSSPTAAEPRKGLSEVYAKFESLYSYLGGNPSQVEKVFMIDNPRQRRSFEEYRRNLDSKHRDNAGLFKREDWWLGGTSAESVNDVMVRQQFIRHLGDKITKFRTSMNDGHHPFILPVVQGTSETGAYRIIKNGFGTAATTDEGWYGRGMYFTSHMKYAAKYGKVFLITLTIPGNVYPVTEKPGENFVSLMGMACKKGYQSHFVEVDKFGQPATAVGMGMIPGNSPEAGEYGVPYANELVIFQEAQTLPLFLVYTKEFAKTDTGLSIPKGPPSPSPAGSTVHDILQLTKSEAAAGDEGQSVWKREEEGESDENFEEAADEKVNDKEVKKLKKEVKELEDDLEEHVRQVSQKDVQLSELARQLDLVAKEKDRVIAALTREIEGLKSIVAAAQKK